ncbi:hypothetical protein DL769_001661 [Monosporascus sp. CRB-8-3]|nr:hypothetical protein DL769_001661 [Monosporascus sp. CRB-8-3]
MSPPHRTAAKARGRLCRRRSGLRLRTEARDRESQTETPMIQSTLDAALRLREHLKVSAKVDAAAEKVKAPPADGSTLTIAQVNLKKSDYRLGLLLDHMKKMPRPWDIVAIQDPPSSFAWRASPAHEVWYEAVPPLSEIDDNRRGKPGNEVDAVPLKGVGFYVVKTIPKEEWRVDPGGNRIKDVVATLFLKTAVGEVQIHNVYNRNKEIDLDELSRACMSNKPESALLGDFNLHHPLWGGDQVHDACERGNKLCRLTQIAGMTCLTSPGAITYSRSFGFNGRYCSTIDLTFAGRHVASRASRCKVLDVRGFETDHRIVETTLNVVANRAFGKWYLWKVANKPDFERNADRVLRPLQFPKLETEADIDGYACQFVSALQILIKQEVEAARPLVPDAETLSSPIKVQMDRERDALRRSEEFPHPRSVSLWEVEKNITNSLLRKHKTRRWRRYIANVTSRPGGIHKIAKRAPRWCKPRELVHMPTLVVGKAKFCTAEAKARCLVESLWPKFSGAPQPSESLARPQPTGSSSDTGSSSPTNLEGWPTSPQNLQEGELSRVFKDLPVGRSALPDYVGNEALKLSRRVSQPYVEHLFGACIKLSYHPRQFKDATTVMLRKSGKETYTDPKSWRPIAPLSCLGKMLEKIIANRLKDIAMQFNLLPKQQFGAPGRSATDALQYLLNIVYRSWCPTGPKNRRVVSLLTLDIEGAYNHVPRDILLSTLESKRIPYWIVLFVWHFLSDRSTILSMPGHTSRRYWLNIGIPQGSPLSPILFHFFTSGMIEVLNTKVAFKDRTIEHFSLGFVDDHHLVVSSSGYHTNCMALETLFETVMGWAEPNGVDFSPAKYAVMHFRAPWSQGPRFKGLPKIKGLTEDKLKTELRILGVRVDHNLNWGPHIEQIRLKVVKEMQYLRRISGSIWGADLRNMRQLYLTKVRPMITYACGAWFISGDGVKWRLSKKLVGKLESLQHDCLLQISGAMKGTPREVVQKELHIESLEVHLQRLALAHRARTVHTPEFQELERIRNRPLVGVSNSSLERHPFRKLHADAIRLAQEARRRISDEKEATRIWSISKRRNKIINKCALQHAADSMSRLWNDYRRRYANRLDKPRPRTAALEEEWGPQSYLYYEGLSRAQSTMLLHCRTGYIGLRAYLHSIKVESIDSDRCPCGTGRHTVEHLFFHCPNLAAFQSEYSHKVNHGDLRTLLTKDASVATQWAICEFFRYRRIGAIPTTQASYSKVTSDCPVMPLSTTILDRILDGLRNPEQPDKPSLVVLLASSQKLNFEVLKPFAAHVQLSQQFLHTNPIFLGKVGWIDGGVDIFGSSQSFIKLRDLKKNVLRKDFTVTEHRYLVVGIARHVSAVLIDGDSRRWSGAKYFPPGYLVGLAKGRKAAILYGLKVYREKLNIS